MSEFWSYLERLLAERRLVIDRPKGSAHPRFSTHIYPLDYGYLEGTTGGDGHPIDVWRGSLEQAVLTGVQLTVDLYKRDAEIKLLVGCSAEDSQIVQDFTDDQSMGSLIIGRSPTAWLHERRSVRRFTQRAVAREVVERLLRAAMQAPSAHNRQPWRFAVLASLEARRRLAESIGAEFGRDLIKDGLEPEDAQAQVRRSIDRICVAPLGILVCLDASVLDDYPDNRRRQAELVMAVQGAAMAAQNLLLAAHAEGLGGVWLCAPLFAQQAARLALDLPPDWQAQGLALIGYPATWPPARPRRPLEDIAVFL